MIIVVVIVVSMNIFYSLTFFCFLHLHLLITGLTLDSYGSCLYNKDISTFPKAIQSGDSHQHKRFEVGHHYRYLLSLECKPARLHHREAI